MMIENLEEEKRMLTLNNWIPNGHGADVDGKSSDQNILSNGEQSFQKQHDLF